jgi:uncharacterized protein YhhL (DUF1145 family)
MMVIIGNIAIGIIVGIVLVSYVAPFGDYVVYWLEVKKAFLQATAQLQANKLAEGQEVTHAIGFEMPAPQEEDEEEWEEE